MWFLWQSVRISLGERKKIKIFVDFHISNLFIINKSIFYEYLLLVLYSIFISYEIQKTVLKIKQFINFWKIKRNHSSIHSMLDSNAILEKYLTFIIAWDTDSAVQRAWVIFKLHGFFSFRSLSAKIHQVFSSSNILHWRTRSLYSVPLL
jgi:hypothetical protein